MTPTTPGAGTTPDDGVFSQPLAHVEVWAPVPGYPNNEASAFGRIRSLPHVTACKDGRDRSFPGQVLRPYAKKSGHLYVTMSWPNRRRRMVHQVVLETFVGPAPAGMEGCHNDGDPANNAVGNLRWDTHSGNMMDRRRHGTDHMVKRIECPWGHQLVEANLVRSLFQAKGQRSCLACSRSFAYQGWMRAKGVAIDRRAVADAYYAEIVAGRGASLPRASPSVEPCLEEGCDRKILARGQCRRHYQIWYRSQTIRKAA